jgi:FtsP/CotA-like multicopper oxidase with cupredoxin domain
VVNASADTIDDLVLKYDGKPQQVEIVALDGVSLNSQDGTKRGKLMPVSDVYIPPSSRAEFIIPPIPANVKSVTLETKKIDTGPAGDIDIKRVVAVIQPQAMAETMAGMDGATIMPPVTGAAGPQRFDSLDNAKVTAVRHLYFSEIFPDPQDPDEGLFYITVNGKVPQLFDPNAPPAITTTKGAVEDWIIQNQTNEVHEFHIHQIHFQVRDINGVPVPPSQRQFRDTFEVPYWSGTGPYPTVKLRMDFRGAVVGDFVYHCHILDHEDAGMMAVIRVKAPGG